MQALGKIGCLAADTVFPEYSLCILLLVPRSYRARLPLALFVGGDLEKVTTKRHADRAGVMGQGALQVRLVEGAVKGPGWGVPDEALRLLPGPAFEVEQASDDKGLPIERPVVDKKLPSAHAAGLLKHPPFHSGAISCIAVTHAELDVHHRPCCVRHAMRLSPALDSVDLTFIHVQAQTCSAAATCSLQNAQSSITGCRPGLQTFMMCRREGEAEGGARSVPGRRDIC